MSVGFLRGQQLGRDDLNLFTTNAAGHPYDAAELYYALYDFTTGMEVLVGPAMRQPVHPALGEYFASLIIPLDANLGTYRIRWYMRETVGGPLQSVVQEFDVQDRASLTATSLSTIELDLVRRLRMQLRDHNPDKYYKFRPPAHAETVSQYNRVFGHVWEDQELLEYLKLALDMIIAAPPRTPFNSIEHMHQVKSEWETLLITGAMIYALQALQINWTVDEFDYSIGGVSLTIEKSSKYESLKNGASELFDKQLDRAKQTVKFIRGLQQPKYGAGIRSAFGPYTGAGVLTPRKFIGV
jgi:hypothetical protein